jgi:glyceraldehyde-3-phosphate dehydrogenase/erythrose-4-phosphate dehydrogenase
MGTTDDGADMKLLLIIEEKKQELAKAQEAYTNYLKWEEEKMQRRKTEQKRAKITIYADEAFKKLPPQEKTGIYLVYECTPTGTNRRVVGYETSSEKANEVMKVFYELSQKHKLNKNYGVTCDPITNYKTISDLCETIVQAEQ